MTDHRIPALSLDRMHAEIETEALDAIGNVYRSRRYVLGSEVETFERAYAEYIGTRHCVTCASGLDALILSLRVLGIGPGDRVLVPSNTYVATWLAPSALGAIPVPVEPDPVTCNLGIENLEVQDLTRVKAIIPVHLYGQACPMPEIVAWATDRGIHVLEDNAQAHGAAVNGQRTGSFGIVNAHSFYPTKNLGALGEGGAITTDDADLAAQLKVLRNYGQRERYINEVKGINSRFDEIQAAFLNVKLRYLDKWNSERRRLAGLYLDALAGLSDVDLPSTWLDDRQVFHIFPFRTGQRDALREDLASHGVGTLVHYPVPPHLQDAYRELGYVTGSLPVAEHIARRELSLPLYPGLSDDDVHHVCRVITGFFSR